MITISLTRFSFCPFFLAIVLSVLLLAIVLSVLFRFTASDYYFDILIPFLPIIERISFMVSSKSSTMR